jgi:hypothetical protein
LPPLRACEVKSCGQLSGVDSDESPPPSFPQRNWPRLVLRAFGLFLVTGFLSAFFVFPFVAKSAPKPQSSVEAGYLRSIVETWLAVEGDLEGKGLPPEAQSDIYAFAGYLASKGMNDPEVWFSRNDPAKGVYDGAITSIVNPDDKRQLDPKFKGAPLAIAVALFPVGTSVRMLPPSTPLVWTRGLMPEGIWRADSPYGERNGMIASKDGSVGRSYSVERNLIMPKWGTDEWTSNILEALPPGTRIGEYTPTADDLRRGKELERRKQWEQQVLAAASIGAPLLLLLLTFAASAGFVRLPERSFKQSAYMMAGWLLATGFWVACLWCLPP